MICITRIGPHVWSVRVTSKSWSYKCLSSSWGVNTIYTEIGPDEGVPQITPGHPVCPLERNNVILSVQSNISWLAFVVIQNKPTRLKESSEHWVYCHPEITGVYLDDHSGMLALSSIVRVCITPQVVTNILNSHFFHGNKGSRSVESMT